MSVFISHMFGGDDDDFAGTLKNDLEAAGLDGYLAEDTPRYDLLISDKIREEIGRSSCLVAIITKHSRASASVHEEVGYALGRGIPVVLMVAKNVREQGVLIYGREPEYFDPQNFGPHSRKVAAYIQGNARTAPAPPPGDAARALLDKRNTLSAESEHFAKNMHYARLYNERFYQNGEKPVVLFTACPGDLRDYQSVTTPEFKGWARSTLYEKFRGLRSMHALREKIDIRALYLTRSHPRALQAGDISAYWEFQDNGFLEYGTSPSIVNERDASLSLHLCHTMGYFWVFLDIARHFYKKLEAKSPCTALLSVRNSSKLALVNCGNEALDRTWMHNPWQASPDTADPRTSRTNIQLSHAFGAANAITDAGIEQAVKEVAQTLCNAYGEDRARCFDENGEFAWRLWGHVAA